ncbi:MAG: tetratricopeptide repeat protein [Gammaproteobacteria bacterium]|nr:tetratricopeptide repeat protein [Gammaproteobacteria bacterium]
MPFKQFPGYQQIFTALIGSLLLSSCASISGTGQSNDQPLQRPAERIYTLGATTSMDKDPVYQLLVGELAVNTGESSLAVDTYLNLALSLDDPRIAERAVRISIFAQDLNAAQMAAERWLLLQPDNSEAMQVISAIYIRQENADRAFYYLDRVISLQPQISDQTFVAILGLLAREKTTDTLLKVSKRIADSYSGYAYAHFLHSHLASRSNRLEETLEYLDNALAIKDILDAHALRAQTLIKMGRRNEAVISLKRAVLSQPDNKQLRLSYARLLVDVKEYEVARIEFEKLQLLAPNDPDLLYTLGLLSLESQRFKSAENYFRSLLNTGLRIGEARYYLGRIKQSQGEYQHAIEWYITVDSGEYVFDAQMRTAQLIALQGDTSEALDFLKKITSQHQSKSSLVRIYLTRGEVLKHNKQFGEAIQNYSEGLELIPGNTDLLYARGLTGESIGNVELLEADMRTILETEPDNAHALNALGFTLADVTDRIQEAYQYLERAIQIKPEDPAIIDSFGWVNYRLGNYDEAIRLLKTALSQVEDGEIAAHLGEVLWVSGNHKEALGVWKSALEKTPDDPFILKTMKRFNQQ